MALPLWVSIPLGIFLSVLAFGSAVALSTWFADKLNAMKRNDMPRRRHTDL